jgi:hypothetical protein
MIGKKETPASDACAASVVGEQHTPQTPPLIEAESGASTDVR